MGIAIEIAAILLAIIVVVLFYVGSRFLRDVRGIRKELANGRTLTELDEMVNESREQLLSDYDKVSQELDKRIDRLDKLSREETNAYYAVLYRFVAMLLAERLAETSKRVVHLEKRLSQAGIDTVMQ